jgi:hypothetical protein
MKEKPKEEEKPEVGCIDCGHYLLEEDSVHVDLTNGKVIATADYVCDAGVALDSEEVCDNFYNVIIEDTIMWQRGNVEDDDGT